MVHGQQLTDAFKVQIGVRQGCLPTVTLPFPVGDGLGNENIKCPEEEWHPMDTLDIIG
jgi:hypothetical protein